MRELTAGVTGHDIDHPAQLVVDRFQAPETTTAEGGNLQPAIIGHDSS
jgi:hypothetical protein